MKLRKIKYRDHPILGNLVLDFYNQETGTPYSTVIFAGENGTGKTTILESVSTFLNLRSFKPFEYIEYESAGATLTAVPIQLPNMHEDFFEIIDSAGKRRQITSNKSNNFASIESDTQDPRHFGCVFSKARSDYKTKKIISTTASSLDSAKYDIDESDDFSSLKQLLIDVENQDNSGYAEINKGSPNSPQSWSAFYPTSKLFRFKNAFDNFFENIEYEKVSDENNEKIIRFKKHNKSIAIDDLSTGEKQIVFRGIYLLKNQKQLDGAVCMIDEPELSMHPKWQIKALRYYKNLFSEGAVQKAQLFFATHSDFIVEEALRYQTDTLVIVLTENNGFIEAKRICTPSVLPSITSAETNYLAFDVPSNDYHIELFGWLQHKENLTSVKSCDTFIANHPKFNSALHSLNSTSPTGTTYLTLCTYIRNAIDHPNPNTPYTDNQLRTSIELLVEICK